MKVGIATFGCDLKSGMGRYASSLIGQFKQEGSPDSFELLAHSSAAEEYLGEGQAQNFQTRAVSERLAPPVLNVFWHQTCLPGICLNRNYDVLFLPAANRRTPIWAPCPVVGTVHDLSPMYVAGKYDFFRNIYQTKVLPGLYKRLTHIIAISESTKRDILEYTDISEDRITVVHHAANTDLFYPRDREVAMNSIRTYGVREPYILYTSRIESPGKNHLRLIQAFELLKNTESIPHQLVLAGADWNGSEEVHAAAVASPYKSDILFTSFVKGQDLPHLYSGAELMVFPSLYEGFGLPILESMSCGVPVVCSNISSMPEIAGGCAILFDPLDVDSIASGILEILSSNERRSQLVKAGLNRATEFSWEKTSSQTLKIIRSVIS